MSNRSCVKRKEPMWRPIPGARRYDASDTGLVREAATGRLLTLTASGRNSDRLFHLTASIVGDDGVRRNRYVHQLVLLAHVGPAPDGAHACHKNDDPADNRLDNLYWGTAAHNQADRRRNGGGDPARAAEIERLRQESLARVRAEIELGQPPRRTPHSPPPGPPRMSLAPRLRVPVDPEPPTLPSGSEPAPAAG